MENLQNLLNSPAVEVRHKDHANSPITTMVGSYPAAVLMYFSPVLRQMIEHNAGIYPYHPGFLTPIHVLESDFVAYKIVLDWMVQCCAQNAILPLSQYMKPHSWFIMTVKPFELLQVVYVWQDIAQLKQQLNQMPLTAEDMEILAVSWENTLAPDLRGLILGQLVSNFVRGLLQDIDKYYLIASSNSVFNYEFSHALAHWHLNMPHHIINLANSAWLNKSPIYYRHLANQNAPGSQATQVPQYVFTGPQAAAPE